MFLYPTTQLAQQRVPPTTGMSRDSSETNSQGQAPAKEKEQFIVKFTEKVSPKEVSSLVKRSRIKAKELLYEFQDEQGDVITGGYTVPEGEDIDSSLQNMLTKHKAFLSEAIATTDEGLATETDQVAIPGLKKLKKQFRKMLDDAQNGRFTLSGLKAAGGSELSKIKAMPHVQSVLPVPVMPGAERQAESARVQFMPASYWHESWAPYYGTAKVTQGFTMQTFYFNNVGGFGSTSTYEHETQVYNRNFADYGYYWSSNLPSAYYDTPFADTLDNFTIGTSRASSLQNYTQYYTYMALRPGTSSSATVRIKGQKGYRWPTWCYSTWCIYPQATTTSMTTFTAPIYYTLPYNY
jgi:hypothetical protein